MMYWSFSPTYSPSYCSRRPPLQWAQRAKIISKTPSLAANHINMIFGKISLENLEVQLAYGLRYEVIVLLGIFSYR